MFSGRGQAALQGRPVEAADAHDAPAACIAVPGTGALVLCLPPAAVCLP